MGIGRGGVMADLTRYKLECVVCHKMFTVPDPESPVPKHPREGEQVLSDRLYVPCAGSGEMGIFRGVSSPNI